MKTKIIALFCACFMLLSAVDMLFPRSEAQIYENAIRLHILAEDNTEKAQAVKLLVRDAILNECGELFSEKTDVDSASSAVCENLANIERIANRVLAENNAGYTATVEWGIESYPTRVYNDFSLPAGEYRSLRVKLGSANGNNWWCILFPPLCTGASTNKDFTVAKVNKNDTSVFTSRKYAFRFKLLELFG